MKKRRVKIIMYTKDFFDNQKEITEQFFYEFGSKWLHIKLVSWWGNK